MAAPSAQALEAAALIEQAADRIERYGWHNGVDWFAGGDSTWVGYGGFGVPMLQCPAWGQAHLYLAVGFNPYLRLDRNHTPPAVVGEAEQQLAAYLVQRGEEPIHDRDNFLDANGMLDRFEGSDGMTAQTVAETFLDCAAWIRERHAQTTDETRKDAA